MILHNDFKLKKDIKEIDFIACDSEARIFLHDKILTTDELYDVTKDEKYTYFKKHAKVDVYYIQFAHNEKVFICDNFNEYFNTIVEYNIKTLWWYNAKYDFAHIEYWLLTNDFECVEKITNAKQYTSLHSKYGQRYKMQIAIEINDDIHIINMYDFFNFFNYGLNNIAKSFNVTDDAMQKLEKLKVIDYQEKVSLDYAKLDVIILYKIVKKYDNEIFSLYGERLGAYQHNLKKNNVSVLTAGGLAKKQLLKSLYKQYPYASYKSLIKFYKNNYPISPSFDKKCRIYGLYRGGLTHINKKYQGKLIKKHIYKYDVNSMYPHNMKTSKFMRGYGFIAKANELNKFADNENYIVILVFNTLICEVKDDMLPIFWDITKRDYSATIDFTNEQFFIFYDEFNELINWYNIILYNLSYIIVYNKVIDSPYSEFVNTHYENKEHFRTIDKIRYQSSKLFLNSSYGKIGENPEREQCKFILNDDGIISNTIIKKTIQDKTTMNVIHASLITSNARIQLMRTMRTITNNVKHDIIYFDTDSIHTFKKMPNELIDDKKLGYFTDESDNYTYHKYLAPKTYANIMLNKDNTVNSYKSHFSTKGINKQIIKDELNNKTIDYFNKRFNYGQKFKSLMAINCRGGKALVTVDKTLAKNDNTLLDYDTILIDLGGVENGKI